MQVCDFRLTFLSSDLKKRINENEQSSLNFRVMFGLNVVPTVYTVHNHYQRQRKKSASDRRWMQCERSHKQSVESINAARKFAASKKWMCFFHLRTRKVDRQNHDIYFARQFLLPKCVWKGNPEQEVKPKINTANNGSTSSESSVSYHKMKWKEREESSSISNADIVEGAIITQYRGDCSRIHLFMHLTWFGTANRAEK